MFLKNNLKLTSNRAPVFFFTFVNSVIRHILHKIQHNKASFLLFIGNGASTLINFLLLSLMAHSLSINDYGTYRQLGTYALLATAFGSLGFSQAVYYQLSIPGISKQQQYTIISMCRLLLILGMILSLIFLLASHWYFSAEFANPQFDSCLFYAIAFSIITVWQSVDTNVFTAIGTYKAYIKTNLSVQLLKGSLFLLCWWMNQPLSVYLWIAIACGVFGSSIAFSRIQARFKEERWIFDRDQLLQQLKYGFPVGLGAFLGVIMLNTDRMVLANFTKDVKAFAILANGAFEVPLINNFYFSFFTMALPQMIAAYHQNNTKALLKARFDYIELVAPVLFPVALIFMYWSTPLMSFLFGEDYSASGPVFAIFSSILLLRFCSHHDIFFALERTRIIIYLQCAEVLLNLGLTIFLVQKWGIIGAAAASAITNYLYMIATAIISRKLLGVPMADLFPFAYLGKYLLWSCLALSISILLFTFLPSHWFLQIFFFSGLYALLIFRSFKRKLSLG